MDEECQRMFMDDSDTDDCTVQIGMRGVWGY